MSTHPTDITPLSRLKLAEWLLEAGFEAMAQEFVAIAGSTVDTEVALRIADALDAEHLPEADELLPEKLRAWAYAVDAEREAPHAEPRPLADVLAEVIADLRARRIDGNRWAEPHIVPAGRLV